MTNKNLDNNEFSSLNDLSKFEIKNPWEIKCPHYAIILFQEFSGFKESFGDYYNEDPFPKKEYTPIYKKTMKYYSFDKNKTNFELAIKLLNQTKQNKFLAIFVGAVAEVSIETKITI